MSLTKATYSMIDGAPVNVLDFGAVADGVTDSTAAIQSAINYASNNNRSVVYFPAGKYLTNTLYVTYDAALNPNFNSSINGRITLKGEGKIPGADYTSWTTSSPVIGTLLISSATTLSAVILSTSTAAYANRQQVIKDMTIAANTTAYVVENNAAPDQSGLENVAIIQQNAAGSGVFWKSSWYTYWRGVIIGTPSTVTSTGNGLVFESALFAGLFNFISCSFTGNFANSVKIGPNSGSANLAFQNCGFESATNAGLLIDAEVRSISLRDCYWENNGVNHIKVNTASGVTNLVVDSGLFFGGNTAATAPSGSFIDLQVGSSADISNCTFFRPHTTLVYNEYDAGNPSGNRTTVRNCAVDVSGATYGGGAFFYCFDSNDQNGIPLSVNNQITPSAVVVLVNPAYLLGSAVSGSASRYLSYGFTSVFSRAMDVAFEQDFPQTTLASVRLYTTTAASCSVQMPSGGISESRTFYLANSSTSTQSLDILQNGGGTLTTLAAGTAVICIGNPATSKWVALKTTFFD